MLKTKHPLIFTFLPNVDYNLAIVKIAIFILSFSIYYSINTLFFTDKEIHKIYKNHGNMNISSHIPKIILSFLISHILCSLIKYFSLSERNLLEIKYDKKGKNSDKKIDEVKRCLFVKNLFFFLLGLVFLIGFWYYLSSFAAVYKNSQIYPFINTLISVLISLIYPFIINLIPGIFRIRSLNQNRNIEFLYTIDKILQYL